MQDNESSRSEARGIKTSGRITEWRVTDSTHHSALKLLILSRVRNLTPKNGVVKLPKKALK